MSCNNDTPVPLLLTPTRQTLISQDVALFSGTVRSNLDPFEEHGNDECLDVLQRCHLTALLERRHGATSNILDVPIDKGGSLSAGERQLMALARAILRQTSVIIMDEATSQIDVELDEEVRESRVRVLACAKLTSRSLRSSARSARSFGRRSCSQLRIDSIPCLTATEYWSWERAESWSSIPLLPC